MLTISRHNKDLLYFPLRKPSARTSARIRNWIHTSSAWSCWRSANESFRLYGPLFRFLLSTEFEANTGCCTTFSRHTLPIVSFLFESNKCRGQKTLLSSSASLEDSTCTFSSNMFHLSKWTRLNVPLSHYINVFCLRDRKAHSIAVVVTLPQEFYPLVNVTKLMFVYWLGRYSIWFYLCLLFALIHTLKTSPTIQYLQSTRWNFTQMR